MAGQFNSLIFYIMINQETQRFNNPDMFLTPLIHISNFLLEFARRRKPSGLKKERKRGKLPNQNRHDRNAAIAVGTWKHKGPRSRKK